MYSTHNLGTYFIAIHIQYKYILYTYIIMNIKYVFLQIMICIN